MQALLKAIDTYIEKADNNLIDTLRNALFINATDTVCEITALEDLIARALMNESRLINRHLTNAVNLEAFANEWPHIKSLDDIDEALAALFYDSFMRNMPNLVNGYMAQVDAGLKVSKICNRTLDWAKDWSHELGKLMKLTTHETVEYLLINNLRDGNSVADFTRALQESKIREEYYRARRVAVTEMLRVHSVAQQEAITQNPAIEDKKWVHTGEYRNKPRDNHIEISGQIVRADQPFTLIGKDGNTYYPMYPRDSCLPPGEVINCHCIHQGIVNAEVLGLSLEERQALQEKAISEDNGLWERRLDARNRARAGIE